MAGYEGGYTSAINSANLRGMYQQQVAQMQQAQMRAAVQQAMEREAVQRKLQAQEHAGFGLPAMFGPSPQIAQPPAPQGSPANPMPPGVGQPSVPATPPQQPLGEPQTPPYEAMPSPPLVRAQVGQNGQPPDIPAAHAPLVPDMVAAARPGAERFQATFGNYDPAKQVDISGDIPAPPVPAAPAPAPAGAAPKASPSVSALQRFVKGQVDRGVTGGDLTRSILEIAPMLNSEAQQALKAATQEISLLRTQEQLRHNRAMEPIAAERAAAATTTAAASGTRAGAAVTNADTAAARAATAERQGDERLGQGRRRLSETERHNVATEESARDRNAVARERIALARTNGTASGLKGKMLDSYVHNESNIDSITEIINELEKNPEAVGFKTLIPGIALNRADPEGTPIRASIANLTSMTIRDRAGTAQTAQELKNIAPFIPRDGDDYPTVVTKLKGMQKQMRDLNSSITKNATVGGGAGTPIPRTALTGGAGPAVGEKRVINGTPAHWDGKGWLPD